MTWVNATCFASRCIRAILHIPRSIALNARIVYPSIPPRARACICVREIYLSLCRYGPAKEALFKNMGLTEDEVHDVAGGTAQALFGAWGDAA